MKDEGRAENKPLAMPPWVPVLLKDNDTGKRSVENLFFLPPSSFFFLLFTPLTSSPP